MRPSSSTLCTALTGCARTCLPSATAQGVVLLNDYLGPTVHYRGDLQALQERLTALLGVALERTPSGCLLFSTEIKEGLSGLPIAETQIAGSHLMLRPEDLARALPERAPLESEAPDASTGIATTRALCPRSGALITVASKPREGTLVLVNYVVEPLADAPDDGIDAAGATAWLIADHPLAFAALPQQLYRLGWRHRRFSTVADANEAVDRLGHHASPAFVLGLASYGVRQAELLALAQRLSDSEVVLGLEPDAGGEAATPPLRCEPLPLGRMELLQITERAARRVADAGMPTVADADEPPAPRRVLVVDDNPVTQLVATEVLRSLGFRTEVAVDGAAAIKQCRELAPHAVLMDVEMPSMDGLAATRRLRELQAAGALPYFPIIVVTALVSAEDEQRCRESGADAYLRKPLDAAELYPELQRVIE